MRRKVFIEVINKKKKRRKRRIADVVVRKSDFDDEIQNEKKQGIFVTHLHSH